MALDILEDLRDHLVLLDRRDLKDLMVRAVTQDLADQLQDIQAVNLRDQEDRREVQVAIQVLVVDRKDLMVQGDILQAADQAVHRFPVDPVDLVDPVDHPDQEVFQKNLRRARRSHRKVPRSQIVSTCHRELDNHESKRSSRYLTTTPTVVNAG